MQERACGGPAGQNRLRRGPERRQERMQKQSQPSHVQRRWQLSIFSFDNGDREPRLAGEKEFGCQSLFIPGSCPEKYMYQDPNREQQDGTMLLFLIPSS